MTSPYNDGYHDGMQHAYEDLGDSVTRLEAQCEHYRLEMHRHANEKAVLRNALIRIAECECWCNGYYRCNGCETIPVGIAQEALDATPLEDKR